MIASPPAHRQPRWKVPCIERTLEAAWNRMKRRNLLVECVMGLVAGKKIPASIMSCTKARSSSLTHNQVLYQALARSLRESKVQFVVQDAWPFGERASAQNGKFNPLRIDITTEAGVFFDKPPTQKEGASTRHYHRYLLRQLQSGECSTSCRKTPRRRSRLEVKQVLGLVPRYLLLLSSRYVDMW